VLWRLSKKMKKGKRKSDVKVSKTQVRRWRRRREGGGVMWRTRKH
jgi:hypothetical protein